MANTLQYPTLQQDQKHVWHPFTQHQTARLPIAIQKGKGAYLYDENGKAYLDLISSWWVNLHGHAHPHIADAIHRQAQTLEHVIFAGFTHEPAVRLAESLCVILPDALTRVFYTDNGSTAIEVAMKMAYQYWANQGVTSRKTYLSFEGGYHGDTFGAMAIGKSSGFYDTFSPFLFDVLSMPYPYTWIDDAAIEEKETKALQTLDALLNEHHETIAGFICEPLLQGASGMRCCRPQFLKAVIDKLRHYGILIIFDEIMTGFGRTGTMFALEQVGATPDIICLSKGLTGGFLPMSVTICQEYIYEAFLSGEFDKALIHGHSYTANPLGCAAALASLEVFEQEQTLEKIKAIQRIHREEIEAIRTLPNICAPRIQGTMAAFNLLETETTYTHSIGKALEAGCIAEGLLIRPLGNSVYVLPPYCIQEDDLRNAYRVLKQQLERIL